VWYKFPFVDQVLNGILSHVMLRETGNEHLTDVQLTDKDKNYYSEGVELPSEQKGYIKLTIHRSYEQ
jgi:hypothetical protein